MSPKTGRVLVASGFFLHAALAASIALTLAKMIQTFERITVYGRGNARELSAGISDALDYASFGFLFGWPGLALILTGMIAGRARERWIFWGGITCSVLWLIAFPSGTIIGVLVITVFLWKRTEFFQKLTKAGEPDVPANPVDAPRN